MVELLPGSHFSNKKVVRHFITVLVFAVLVIAAVEAFPQTAPGGTVSVTSASVSTRRSGKVRMTTAVSGGAAAPERRSE